MSLNIRFNGHALMFFDIVCKGSLTICKDHYYQNAKINSTYVIDIFTHIIYTVN